MTVLVQCWYRRRFARRAAAATKLQAALRMRLASRSFQRMRSSALIVQVSTLCASLPSPHLDVSLLEGLTFPQSVVSPD